MRTLKYSIPLIVADGGTTIESSELPINGILLGLVVVAPDLTSSNTYTASILDEEGGTIISYATLTENTTTSKYIDANNAYIHAPLHNPTVKIVSSGAETGAKTFTAHIYYES